MLLLEHLQDIPCRRIPCNDDVALWSQAFNNLIGDDDAFYWNYSPYNYTVLGVCNDVYRVSVGNV